MSFVWVYGSEAHPEENPFQEGHESCDLGWEHPYSITTTMEERAQRARWLKSDPDPDFEIPMMIDYIDTELGPNNAIRAAYPGNFYQGAVIDCDGTILDEQPWGWYDDGGDWWGLPLAHIDGLHALLDDYLADPPDCFYAAGDADADTDTDADGDGAGGGDGDSGGCTTAAVSSPSGGASLIDLLQSAL